MQHVNEERNGLQRQVEPSTLRCKMVVRAWRKAFLFADIAKHWTLKSRESFDCSADMTNIMAGMLKKKVS